MSGDQLQPEDTLDDRGVDDVLDEGYSPPEREPDHLKHPGDGEQEKSDADVVDGDIAGEVGTERTGRLMAPDEGAHEDVEKDMVAQDEGIDGAGASAEEAAMHTIEE